MEKDTKINDEEKSQPSTSEVAQGPPPFKPQLTGWRLGVTITAAFVGFFLSLLDTTIVAVALPTIANQFQSFDQSTWVVNAYLISYMAFAIIISRLSDIFGRKSIEVTCFVLFIAFSMGCALSRSMTQLIVFRAIQGIGGCGLYSMALVIGINNLRPEQRPMMSAYASICVVVAGILGPVLGGAITLNVNSGTWPWIFWINLPIGGIALIAMLIAWPNDKSTKTLTVAALKKIDFLGSLLLLAASALLVFALQEAGAYEYAWDSATIIACLTIAGVSLVAFIGWQTWLFAHPNLPTKVVFPVNLMGDRVIVGAILAMFFSGFTYFTAAVNLPQRFQIVSGSSPIIAGVRMLPLLGASAVGSVVGGVASKKKNLTSYTLTAAGAFQVLGYGLMTTLGNSRNVPAKTYGFEVFLGLGFGMGISSVTLMMEQQVEPQWMAVTQGALAQVRTLGGSVGLAVAVIIFNVQARSSDALQTALSPSQRDSLFRSPYVIETFAPGQQLLVAGVFAEAFTDQMRVATYIGAASFLAGALTLQRRPPQMLRMTAKT